MRISTIALAFLLMATACSGDAGWRALRAQNAESLYAPATMDSLLAAESTLSASERVGLWARRFLDDDDSRYLFGLKPGGYVAEGLLVSDHAHDCVSLMYRATELARSGSSDAALRLALATRFAGAPLDSLIDDEGRVDYERPEHLDFSLDMIRSGHWGHDITASLSGAVPDAEGTARYPAGSFSFVPKTALVESELREGDIVWLVLDPEHEGARRLRDEYGLAIGHIGLIILEEGRPWLVHAASNSLEGCYEGGRVVKVALGEYLRRVERFAGVMVTRFD